MYKNIENCKDKQLLLNKLDTKSLDLIESILNAYNLSKIDFVEPRNEDGEPDYLGEFKLVINNDSYAKTGMELLVLKWYEDIVETEYLLDCFVK